MAGTDADERKHLYRLLFHGRGPHGRELVELGSPIANVAFTTGCTAMAGLAAASASAALNTSTFSDLNVSNNTSLAARR